MLVYYHHKFKDITFWEGFYLELYFDLDISEGSLVGMVGQKHGHVKVDH